MQDRVRWSRLCLWPFAFGWMALNAARLLQLQALQIAAAAVTTVSLLAHLGLSAQIARFNHRARPQKSAITVHLDAPLAARWHALSFVVGGLALAIAYAQTWPPSAPRSCEWPQGCFVFGGICWLFALSHPISWALTLRGVAETARQILTALALLCLASLHFANLL